MQLRSARLCLDCEEIHDSQECPVCLSEAFVYLSRWIPTEERRRTIRGPGGPKAAPEPAGIARWVQRGMLGLAIVAAGKWLWQADRPAGKADRPGVPPDSTS
jgi:hypothetical protein